MVGLGASVIKRTGLKIFSILVGVAIALVCFEVGATAWLTMRDGKYTPSAKLFTQNTNTFVQSAARESGCRYGDTLFPHPYLAFVHSRGKPCSLPGINNIGLFGEDFPDQRRTDRYVILLTGGSVARCIRKAVVPMARKTVETSTPGTRMTGPTSAWRRDP